MIKNRGTQDATLRRPFPVTNVAEATRVDNIYNEPVALASGVAGTTGSFVLSYAPVSSSGGDLVGRWGDSSITIASGVLTTEVAWETVSRRHDGESLSSVVQSSEPHFDYTTLLTQGEYYLVYETGRVYYCKADVGTAITVTYKVRTSASTIVVSGIEVDNVVITSMPPVTGTVAVSSVPYIYGEALVSGTVNVGTVSGTVSVVNSPWRVSFSTSLEASRIAKASAGTLRYVSQRLDSSAPAATYYLQMLDSATLPANGAVTLLCAPTKVVHASGVDDAINLDFTNNGIAAVSGIVSCLSSTEYTKTISGDYLTGTVLFS